MSNLRDRLRRIQEQKSSISEININKEQRTESKEQRAGNIEQRTENNEQRAESKRQKNANDGFDLSNLTNNGWETCGYNVLKRDVCLKSRFKTLKTLPYTLPVLIPDLKGKDFLSIEDFVFFDLETSGLSTGSGTVAFLAAFGRIISNSLHITQYLLLDFSGQNDFLENVLSQINNKSSIIVTFNGKTFDSQILKTMCVMNRIIPPEYFHADLLHPSRRLWKKIIHDCSQCSIETKILEIDRTGDISGEFAPDIWFDFIKTGKTERLIQICDHNIKDIFGLSSILNEMITIAKNPFNDKYRYDIERLALYWRKYSHSLEESNMNDQIIKTGSKLLKYAAEKECPKAVYLYGYDQMRNKNYIESLKFVNVGLKLFEKDSIWHKKLIRRKERLNKKIKPLEII